MRGALLLPAALAGCAWFSPPEPPSRTQYVVGAPYPAGGVWYYPAPSFHAQQTGLASIQPDDHRGLTANGERFDQTVLAAAHQTLQLPAIAELTNLENGRALTLRINDRGPPSPSRLVAVTRRVANLLGFAEAGVTRVRLSVLDGPSRAAVSGLAGEEGQRLAIAAAPRSPVQESALPLPAGAIEAPALRLPTAVMVAATAEAPASVPAALPERLPEMVTQSIPQPGSLFVRLGQFSRSNFAESQAARAGAPASAIRREGFGRNETWSVSLGPFENVADADWALMRVIGAGIPDARIVVE